jgi:hypothetical protein
MQQDRASLLKVYFQPAGIDLEAFVGPGINPLGKIP